MTPKGSEAAASAAAAMEAAEYENVRLLPDVVPVVVTTGSKKSAGSMLQGVKVLFYCALYLCVGPTLIIVNRSLLKEVYAPV